MQFVHPHWLYLGVAASGALIAAMVFNGWRRRRALRKFIGDRRAATALASLSRGRRRLKQVLLVLGVMAAFAALARPQWGYHWEEARRTGIDVVFAIDSVPAIH